MAIVSLSAFKARLSAYLREVKRGGEIQLVERGVPVARVVGMETKKGQGGQELVRARLIKSGLVRPARGKMADVLKKKPVVTQKNAQVREALSDEREDRL